MKQGTPRPRPPRAGADRAAARQRTPSQDVEDALLEAAERLLLAEGPDALSVRRLAAEAGVAPMGVYNHFGGKNGVVDALFLRGFDDLRNEFTSVHVDDPAGALREAGLRYRRFAKRHPARYAVMFEHAVPDFQPSPEAHEHADATFAALVAMVQRAIDAGQIAGRDASTVAQQLWSTCHGFVSLELRDLAFVDDVDAAHADLVDALLRGLAPPSPTRRPRRS